MPITWGVDHDNRVVSATGRGVLTKKDFDSYLDELAAAATLPFGKIFHMAAGCRLQLSKDDLLGRGPYPGPRSPPIDGQGRRSRGVR